MLRDRRSGLFLEEAVCFGELDDARERLLSGFLRKIFLL
jgi:hypothetical protein